MASPLRARGYQYYTVTEYATEIVHVTSTAWVDPAQYGPTEVPTTTPDRHEKNKNHGPTNTPSVSISETLASPIVSSSISELSLVPSSTLAYSSVETTQQTTLSIPSTTTSTTLDSIPTTTSSPTTSPPTKPNPKTTSELPTSTPILPSTSISVLTCTQVPPTTLETSTLPVPTTISTPVKTEPSTSAPAPVPSNPVKAPAGGSSGSHTGEATFFNTGMGACGVTSQDSDMMVALAAGDFDPTSPGGNPNKNSLCGKSIRVSYKGGPEVICKILDRCPECVSSPIVKC